MDGTWDSLNISTGWNRPPGNSNDLSKRSPAKFCVCSVFTDPADQIVHDADAFIDLNRCFDAFGVCVISLQKMYI